MSSQSLLQASALNTKNILKQYRILYKNIKSRELSKIFKDKVLNSKNLVFSSNENQILIDYLIMKRYIREENELLTSYNINVLRDDMKQIERTANYVGLRI